MRETACQELTAYQEQQVTKAEASDTRTPVFAECSIPEANHTGGTAITIRLHGAVVEIHPGADTPVIESTLRALRTR